MVTITLTNNNPLSQDTNVRINLRDRICIFPDKREIALEHFLQQTDFHHPLLVEQFTLTPDYVFHYEYDNIRELFFASIWVYTILLHVDKPSLCSFKINASQHYQPHQVTDDLYFSIDSNKPATEPITIKQLNSIVSQMMNIDFVFLEDLIIYDTFTMEHLPPTVNGDLFYIFNEEKLRILENPSDLSRFELRYINPMVGFGVFCKTPIKKGELLTIYAGVKAANEPNMLNFSFKPDKDCLNMSLDAKYYGNITRFINHAPDPDINKEEIDCSRYLIANTKSRIYYINGIEVIIYYAKKDIMPGEQFLVSYGEAYFKEINSIRFKMNGRPLKATNKFSKRRILHFRIMANNGVKKAQTYLRLRLLIIVSTICIVMGGLKLISI